VRLAAVVGPFRSASGPRHLKIVLQGSEPERLRAFLAGVPDEVSLLTQFFPDGPLHFWTGDRQKPRSGSADHVLRQERDANVEAAERASELNASGDPDAARGVMRERESHLNERIDEIRSSSSYSEEDKERMLRPMEAERDSLQRFGQEYASIGQ